MSFFTGQKSFTQRLNQLWSRVGNALSDIISAETAIAYLQSQIIKEETGTSYTLVAADFNPTLVRITNAAGISVELPLDATLNFPVGRSIEFVQGGAGVITLSVEGGGTITGEALATAAQYQKLRATKIAADTWEVYVYA